MAIISFVDDNCRYIKNYISRDYTILSKQLKGNSEAYSYFKIDNDILYAYKITKNEPLSSLYNNNFYTVKFSFANIDTLHTEMQEKQMVLMIENLNSYIEENKGYYNLRLPTHIIDLIRAYNKTIKKSIFCGGTVEQYIHNKKVDLDVKNDLHIFFADKQYIDKHKEKLLSITYKSFETYQGQYHISNVTSPSAGKIYENWINQSFSKNANEKIIIAELGDIPIGFVTIAEDEFCVEGILSAVSEEHRQYGAYKKMISYIINYAYDNKKCFITSTQFDNFIVQGTWNSLGLKPFYSIYNVHIDNR